MTKTPQHKTHLQRGINFMAVSLPLLILAPVTVNIGFKAQQKGGIDFILYIGIALAILAIVLFVLGIKSILKHLFND